MWERLKWLREKLLGDMPQRALAGLIEKRTGFKVSHVSIGRYESEDEKTRRIPKADYIEAICDLTNSTYEWVLTGTGPRERQPTGADPYQTAWREAAAELRALVERFDKRAGKAPGPDGRPGEGEPTGPPPGEGPSASGQDALDRHLKRRQSPGGTGTDG